MPLKYGYVEYFNYGLALEMNCDLYYDSLPAINGESPTQKKYGFVVKRNSRVKCKIFR